MDIHAVFQRSGKLEPARRECEIRAPNGEGTVMCIVIGIQLAAQWNSASPRRYDEAGVGLERIRLGRAKAARGLDGPGDHAAPLLGRGSPAASRNSADFLHAEAIEFPLELVFGGIRQTGGALEVAARDGDTNRIGGNVFGISAQLRVETGIRNRQVSLPHSQLPASYARVDGVIRKAIGS